MSTSRHSRKKVKPSPYQSLIDELKNLDETALLEKLKDIPTKSSFNKKDNLEHWNDILSKIHSFFENLNSHIEVCTPENKEEPTICVPKSSFPYESVITVLRFLRFLFEKTHNRKCFNSVERLAMLLGIVTGEENDLRIETLQTLAALVKPLGGREANESAILGTATYSKIFALALGWGGKDNGLGLLKYLESKDLSPPPLHFEFYDEQAGQKIIHIPDISRFKESSYEMLQQTAAKFNVPENLQFALFARIMLAKHFTNPSKKNELVLMRLLAFSVIGTLPARHTFFLLEPSFVNELVELMQTESPIAHEIQLHAIKALGVAVTSGMAAGFNVTEFSSHYGAFSVVFRRAITAIISDSIDSTYNQTFFDHLFALLKTLVSLSGAVQALNASGVISTLLPVINFTGNEKLEESQKTALKVVDKVIKIIDVFMDYDDSTIDLVKDLGGVDELIKRATAEVAAIQRMEAKDDDSTKEVLNLRTELVEAILSCILPCIQGRMGALIEPPFLETLCDIFKHASKFSSTSYTMASSVLATMLHNEPTCFATLQASGVPDAFLNSVTHSLPVSSKVLENIYLIDISQIIVSIPTALSALCLNSDMLNKIISSDILKSLMGLFSNLNYVEALSKSSPALGTGVDELLRHHPNLKPPGIAAIIKMLEEVAALTSSASEAATDSKQPSSEVVVTLINNAVKFLESFFNGGDHAPAFIERKGLDLVLKFFGILSTSTAPTTNVIRNVSVLFHLIGIQSIGEVLKLFMENIKLHLKQIDELCQGKKDTLLSLIEEASKADANSNNRTVIRVVGELTSYTNVLVALVREAANFPSAAFFNILNDSSSVEAFNSLGQLERSVLWETGCKAVQKANKKPEKPAEKPQGSNEPTSMNVDNSNNNQSNQSAQPNAVPAQADQNKVTELPWQLIAAIHALSRALVRSLAMPTRRREDRALFSVCQMLSQMFIEHFTWLESKDATLTLEKVAYLGSVVGEMRNLLFDDKRMLAHTLLLYFFNRANGFPVMFQYFDWTVKSFFELKSKGLLEEPENKSDTESAQTPLSMIETALGSFAGIMDHLVNSHALLTSPLTANMMTQTLPGQRGPFDPHSFVRTLHDMIFKVLSQLWTSSAVQELPRSVVNTLTSAISRVLENDEGVESAQPTVQAPVANFQPDPATIAAVMEMGFPRSQVEEALRQIGHNNPQLAAEWLINNPQPYDDLILQDSFQQGIPEPQPTDMDDDPELALALQMSMGVGPPKKEEPKKEAVPEPAPPKTSFKENLINSSLDMLISSKDTAGAAPVTLLLVRYLKKQSNQIDNIINSLAEHLKKAFHVANETTICNVAGALAALVSDETILARPVAVHADLVGPIVEMLASTQNNLEKVPSWFTNVLTILDSLAQPQLVTPKEQQEKEKSKADELSLEFVQMSLLSTDQQQLILKVLLGYLSVASKLSPDELRALLSLLARLTRNFDIAGLFLQQNGVESLFKLNLSNSFPTSMNLIGGILRHIVEDSSTLQSAMEAELVSIMHRLTQRMPAHQPVNVTPRVLLSHTAAMLCRDPIIYLQSATNTCRLITGTTNICLATHPTSKTTQSNNQNTIQENITNTPSKTKPKKITDNLKQLIHALIDQLVVAANVTPVGKKSAEKADIAPMEVEPTSGNIENNQLAPKPLDEPFFNTSNILSLLSSIVASYPLCSNVILRHKFSTPQYENIISYLINETLPHTTPTPTESEPVPNTSIGHSEMTTKLLTALCTKPDGRKKVLTELLHSLSENAPKLAQPSVPSQKFGPHLIVRSQCEFLSTLLSSRIAVEIAKLLMELDAGKVFTLIVCKLDLNNPETIQTVYHILRPLEKMSKPSFAASGEAKKSDAPAPHPDDVIASLPPTVPVPTNMEEEGEADESISESSEEESENEDQAENVDESVNAAPVAHPERDDEDEEEDEDEQEEDEEEEEEEDGPVPVDEPVLNINPDGSTISITLPELNVPLGEGMFGVGEAFRAIQRLFPGLNVTNEPPSMPLTESEPPFVLMSSDGSSQDLRRVFRFGGQPAERINAASRWTDDGSKPTQTMVAYAVKFEKILLDKLSKITEEENQLKEKQKEQEMEKEKDKPETIETPATATQPVEPTPTQPTLSASAVTSIDVVPASQEPQPTPSPAEPVSQPPISPVTHLQAPQHPVLPATPASPPAPVDSQPPQPPQPSSFEVIDPAFLEALPEELRAEVLASQINLAVNNAQTGSSTSLNPDFLAALPADIQAEVLQQEQQRLRREQQAQHADTSRAEDMDNASFIATLPPDLREEILLTSDDNFIATLPPQLAAEANALRERAYRQRFAWRARSRDAPEIDFSLPGRVPGFLRSSQTLPADAKGKSILEDEDSIRAFIKLLFLREGGLAELISFLSNLCLYESSRKITTRLLLATLNELGTASRTKEYHARTFAEALEEAGTGYYPQTMFGYHTGLPYNAISYFGAKSPGICRRIITLFSQLIAHNVNIAEFMLNIEKKPESTPTPEEQPDKEKDLQKQKEQAEKQHEIPPITTFLNLLGLTTIRNSSACTESVLGTVTATFKVIQKKLQAPFVVPEIPESALENMISVLASTDPLCKETAYENINYLMPELVKNEHNSKVLLNMCLQHVQQIADLVKSKLSVLCQQLDSKSVSPAIILSTFSSSINVSISLLRLLKSTIALIAETQKDTNSTDFLYSNLKLEPLWEVFETTMSGLAAVANISSTSLSPLLPLAEAFFVAHASSISTGKLVLAENNNNSNIKLGRFFKFAEQYRKLLNDAVKQNPSLLEDSFSLLLKAPHLLDFENKRAYFKSQIQKMKADAEYDGIRITVRRQQVFEDSFYSLRSRRPEELKGRLTVQFAGEEGIDAGGLSREWYTILAREMFNPNYGLFVKTFDSSFQPNKNSYINQEHLDYFKVIGRVIGKALYDGQLLEAHFSRSFYKHILGVPVSSSDMEAVDPDFYRSLKWMLDNDVTTLDLTFSTQSEDWGVVKTVELKPGGANIAVTNENKEEYVKLMCEMKLTTAIKPQITSFLQGFHDLIKPELIGFFTPSELELLISGLPDIDIDDLRQNTEYRGYTTDSPTVQWFWKIVGDFNQEDRALLLQFVTGTSKVPLEGFKALIGMSGPTKFQIHKSYDKHKLPTAHTCFNQLDLPEYPSMEELKRALLVALHEGSEGFGFG